MPVSTRIIIGPVFAVLIVFQTPGRSPSVRPLVRIAARSLDWLPRQGLGQAIACINLSIVLFLELCRPVYLSIETQGQDDKTIYQNSQDSRAAS
jgi:hypothetical protein